MINNYNWIIYVFMCNKKNYTVEISGVYFNFFFRGPIVLDVSFMYKL